MDLQIFFEGIAFFIGGLVCLFWAIKEKRAFGKNSWQGEWTAQYIHYWGGAILGMISGSVFTLKAVFKYFY